MFNNKNISLFNVLFHRSYNAKKYSALNTVGEMIKNGLCSSQIEGNDLANDRATSSCEVKNWHVTDGFSDKHCGPNSSRSVGNSCDKEGKDTSRSFHTQRELSAGTGGNVPSRRRKGSDSVSKDLGLLQKINKESSPVRTSPVATKLAEPTSPSRRHRKSDQLRTKSLGDIVEPLNAQRLRPIRQKTRNAVVSILEEGEVCLEFFQPKNGQDLVMEVIRISSNGMKISVYHPNSKKGVLLSSRPPPQLADTTHLFSTLPSKYWKKYQYAARFVHLVRKKTPKVIFMKQNSRA